MSVFSAPSNATTAKSMRFINVLLAIMVGLLMVSLVASVLLVARQASAASAAATAATEQAVIAAELADAARVQSEVNSVILVTLDEQVAAISCLIKIIPVDRTPEAIAGCQFAP